MIADVDVVRLEHVHRPRVLSADAAVDLTLRLNHAMDNRSAGQPLRGQRTADQDFAGWIKYQPSSY